IVPLTEWSTGVRTLASSFFTQFCALLAVVLGLAAIIGRMIFRLSAGRKAMPKSRSSRGQLWAASNNENVLEPCIHAPASADAHVLEPIGHMAASTDKHVLERFAHTAASTDEHVLELFARTAGNADEPVLGRFAHTPASTDEHVLEPFANVDEHMLER